MGITGAAVAAAAQNGRAAVKLLPKTEPGLKIPESLLVAVARRPNTKVSELLPARGANIEITEMAATAAANSTTEAMKLLLESGPSTNITMKALAKSAC
jgi:hypothetical protein